VGSEVICSRQEPMSSHFEGFKYSDIAVEVLREE